MRDYTYEKWLAGHATRKSMMEKLERSLIPYELFACIPLKNSKERISARLRMDKTPMLIRGATTIRNSVMIYLM